MKIVWLIEYTLFQRYSKSLVSATKLQISIYALSSEIGIVPFNH